MRPVRAQGENRGATGCRTSGKCIGESRNGPGFFSPFEFGTSEWCGLNRKSVFSRNYNVERIRASIFQTQMFRPAQHFFRFEFRTMGIVSRIGSS